MKPLEYVRLKQRLGKRRHGAPNGPVLNVSASAWTDLLDRLSQKQ